MKILQTPARFYPHVGGVESYVYNLSRELVKIGHDLSVICANEPNAGDEVVDGVKVKRLGYVGKIANTNITPKLPYAIWKEDFDVIHTHLPTPWSADWSAVISKVKEKPLVLTYHNNIIGSGFASQIANIYRRTMMKFVLGKADKIIVTNKKQLKFSPFLGGYAEKVKIIPPGVDTKKFKPLKVEKEENSVFFLSVLDRFHEYKGLEHLLRALKIVKNEINDVKLTVGGGGELTEHYKGIAHQLGLKDNVDFIGQIAESELVKQYNMSELFVLPSTSPAQEGFGIVLLEAMACGVPVVTTDIVGMAEEIEKENAGIVITPTDAESLADAIVIGLENKKNGKNARRLAERYNWRIIAKNISEVYSSIS
ncbi:glycosyltransferase family 4 protein [Candidatus Micrarchaeota archaeon]|nr:glycosyltransferase family 4 protein [Candidatus Micrarchaeota archaeon]